MQRRNFLLSLLALPGVKVLAPKSEKPHQFIMYANQGRWYRRWSTREPVGTFVKERGQIIGIAASSSGSDGKCWVQVYGTFKEVK